MVIQRSEHNGWVVLAVSGEVDVPTAPALREAIHAELDSGNINLIIDMELVKFLDSTGNGVLVGGLKKARNHEGDLMLVVTDHKIAKVFEVTGLIRVFRLFGSVSEALAAVDAQEPTS